MLPDLAYDRRGSGPPVVLLHGIGHRRQAWAPIAGRLAADHEVIACDLAGFGDSPAFPGAIPHTMERLAEHLGEQFARWGVDRPHVVGNSLGGAIALELGSRDLVSSVTALSPAGFARLLDWPRALAILIGLRLLARLTPAPALRTVSASERGRRLTGQLLHVHPERVEAEQAYADALALKHATAFERTLRYALTYRFTAPVNVPTTIAWGTEDRLLPHAQTAIARGRLPTARHVDLVGSGHVPMSDDPDRIVEIIARTVTVAGRRPASSGRRADAG